MILCNSPETQAGSAVDADWKISGLEVSARPKVWLVDDNGGFRGLLALLLAEEGGFDCSREFSCSETVLEALAKEPPPDVILLDVQMQGECGLEAIEPIKSLTASTHVIMLTTCFDSIYRTRAEQSGATDFLLKSYSIEQIIKRVREALEQPVPVVKVSVQPAAVESAHDLEASVVHDWLARGKMLSQRILHGAVSRLTVLF